MNNITHENYAKFPYLKLKITLKSHYQIEIEQVHGQRVTTHQAGNLVLVPFLLNFIFLWNLLFTTNVDYVPCLIFAKNFQVAIFDFYSLEISSRKKYFEVFGSGPIVSFYHLLSRFF